MCIVLLLGLFRHKIKCLGSTVQEMKKKFWNFEILRQGRKWNEVIIIFKTNGVQFHFWFLATRRSDTDLWIMKWKVSKIATAERSDDIIDVQTRSRGSSPSPPLSVWLCLTRSIRRGWRGSSSSRRWSSCWRRWCSASSSCCWWSLPSSANVCICWQTRHSYKRGQVTKSERNFGK